MCLSNSKNQAKLKAEVTIRTAGAVGEALEVLSAMVGGAEVQRPWRYWCVHTAKVRVVAEADQTVKSKQN